MDDNEIVTGCLRGKTEEFQKIVDRYSAPAMALAMNILGNRADAEDVCQETFIQIYRNLEKFDMKRSFKTWLYTILYRRALDLHKKRRRSIELLKKVGRESPELLVSESPSPPREKELPSWLIEHLSPKERTAVCLWANDGYTAQEISEVLHCSSSTARVYLFHARKKIKAYLEQNHVSLQNS